MDEWFHGVARLASIDQPIANWRQVVKDCGSFLDRYSGCGWDTLDVFGCDSDYPSTRIDCQGLVWFIRGRPFKVIGDEARIFTSTGYLTFRKGPTPPRIPIWDLKDLSCTTATILKFQQVSGSGRTSPRRRSPARGTGRS